MNQTNESSCQAGSHQGRTAMGHATTCGYQRHVRARAAMRKPAWVGPLLTFMVRRRSTVRVRQRALQKRRTSALFCSAQLAPERTCGGCGAVHGASRDHRLDNVSRRAHLAAPGVAGPPGRRPLGSHRSPPMASSSAVLFAWTSPGRREWLGHACNATRLRGRPRSSYRSRASRARAAPANALMPLTLALGGRVETVGSATEWCSRYNSREVVPPARKPGDGLSSARACAASRDRGGGCGAAPA
jgi:hypothetical protein